MKRVAVLVAAVVLLAVFTGCNMVSVNEERDGAQVVATVNGENIYKRTVTDQVNTYMSYMGLSETDSAYEQYYNSMLQQYFEIEIQNAVLSQKCDELGIEKITAEQQEELDSSRSSFKESIYAGANSRFSEEKYPDEEERQRLITEYAESRLDDYGFYDGSYDRGYISTYITNNIKEYLAKGYDPTDDDVRAFYDQQLSDQKNILADSLAQLDTLDSSGTLVYVPEGVRYVRNLLIAIPSDIRSQISSMRSSGDTEGADALRDEELAKISDKADEAYKAALEDFYAALDEYGEDPGMKDEETRETGYRIYKGNATYDSAFVEAGMELENIGDISEPTASDFGYYIIQYASDMAAGDKPFEEVKDTLKEYMIEKNREDSYNVSLGNWLDEATIKRYENVLYSK